MFPFNNNTYAEFHWVNTFPSGSEPLMQEVLQQAGSFCRSLGKEINLIESTENSGPFIMGNYPKATIVFECKVK